MDEIVQAVAATANTLRSLFAEKGELVGFEDWDALIGCVITLDRVTQALGNNHKQQAEEVEEDDNGNTDG